MKKTLLVLALLTSIFLIAACTEQAPEGIETPTTNTPTATPSVCGDGECDNSEMCIIDALQSACPDDCGPCPPSLYVEPLSCGNSGCEQTGKNEFTIKVPGSVKARVANLGEALANTMTSDFRCYANNEKVVQHALLKNHKGILFEDYFDLDGKLVDEVRLKARQNTGSIAMYKLDFKRWEQNTLEDFEIICNFEFITHSPIKNEKQTYTIKFQQ